MNEETPNKQDEPKSSSKDNTYDDFLKRTQYAWRTVSIAGINFPDERNLNQNEFLAIYRKHSHLKDFWGKYSPSETEFLISYQWNPGNFGVGRGSHFITNKRLILWDTKQKADVCITLNQVVEFESGKKSQLIVKTEDGKEIQINASSAYMPKLSILQSLLTWFRLAPETRLLTTAKAVPMARGAAKNFYAKKYSATASGFFLIIWLISAANGVFLGFLPTFGILLILGGIGYAVGYARGLAVESEENVEAEDAAKTIKKDDKPAA
jgi:hypothetical protein